MSAGEAPARVWCPGCASSDGDEDGFVPLDDPGLRVTFRGSFELDPDGQLVLDNPHDVFLDYEHMRCGSRVRIMTNARWDEELGDYGPDYDPMYEIDLADGTSRVLTRSEAESAGDPEMLGLWDRAWGPTRASLEALHAEARSKARLAG